MTKFSNSPDPQQRTDSHPNKKQSQKFEGFDFLRAVFALLIIAIHSNLFTLKIGSSSIASILSANVAYLAVPVFFQISLFLFYIKSEKVGPSYFFQKRLLKLVSLYLFWVISKIVFDILLTGKSESLQNSTTSIRAFIEFIVSGGNSPLYFFFSLAFITGLTEVVIFGLRRTQKTSLRRIIIYSSLLASCILVFIFSLLRLPSTIENATGVVRVASSIAQWDYNPLNFLPSIFTTVLVVEEFNAEQLKSMNSEIKTRLYVLLSLFMTFAIYEWNLRQDLLHYSRLSLVFGSWLLLYLALLSTRKVPAAVQFLSGCSLGLYTFHLFFTHGVFEKYPNLFTPLAKVIPGLDILIMLFITSVASVLLTLLFRRVKFLKDFV